MKNTVQPKTIYLKDYTISDYLIDTVFLHFDLYEEKTIVKAVLAIKRNGNADSSSKPLILKGEELVLKNILIDGVKLTKDQYQLDDEQLIIQQVPRQFTLETEVEIKPQNNTKLSGLYKSGNNFCTQCESHGFRRITYYLDRPDVLARFTTCISADKTRYPLLLSNGNLVAEKVLDQHRHWVKWEDPLPKPAYLFALVAGNLAVLEDNYTTLSGRNIKLFIYVEQGKQDQAAYAMQSLKNAMLWDEETYGREYELDIYMIVAVSDFNFGAMENKGLNIFNDKYILAKAETATDDDFINIEEVIGHEYFHNWSGNRVTVRDWFQITLKEGLTVFRDQSFSADMHSKAVKRIQDVRVIRNVQFMQDAGPMAHPIMPDSYIEVNNFYTVTIYNKGAEVIRMLQTLLGRSTFRKAMDLYFSRNDGHAVTTEDFIKAMEDASGLDLTEFRRWYQQAGTPVLTVTDTYDPQKQIYSLNVAQSCPSTPGQKHKKDFHIPLAMGLLDGSGRELALQLQNENKPYPEKTRVLNIHNKQETFRFVNVTQKPVPSLLRNFSAPVKLHYDYSQQDLIFLMKHDTDDFNRWDAGQQLANNILLDLVKRYQRREKLTLPPEVLHAFEYMFSQHESDPALTAEMLILPSEAYVGEAMEVIDVVAVHTARDFMKKTLAQALTQPLLNYYHAHKNNKHYELTPRAMGERKLKNLCLAYLAETQNAEINHLSLQQWRQANNMTDAIGALYALNNVTGEERNIAIQEFYLKWQREALVIDKWFSLQAQSTLPNTLGVVKKLMQNPSFDIKNPNRARSLIGVFCANNHVQFHDLSGEGYVFLAEQVLQIDKFNPHVSARIIEPLIRWRRYDNERQHLMRTQLEHIANASHLSKDIFEIVNKCLHENN